MYITAPDVQLPMGFCVLPGTFHHANDPILEMRRDRGYVESHTLESYDCALCSVNAITVLPCYPNNSNIQTHKSLHNVHRTTLFVCVCMCMYVYVCVCMCMYVYVWQG